MFFFWGRFWPIFEHGYEETHSSIETPVDPGRGPGEVFFRVDFGPYLNTVTRNRTLVLKRFFGILGRFSFIFDDSIEEMEVLY